MKRSSAAEIMRVGPCGLLDAVDDGAATLASGLLSPAPFLRSDAIDLMVRGGFPEIRPLEDRDRMARYESYVGSIVERDVAPVAEVRRPDTLRRLINQLAHRTAEELKAFAVRSARVRKLLQPILTCSLVLGLFTVLGLGPLPAPVRRSGC
jgi:uncharacterized protein